MSKRWDNVLGLIFWDLCLQSFLGLFSLLKLNFIYAVEKARQIKDWTVNVGKHPAVHSIRQIFLGKFFNIRDRCLFRTTFIYTGFCRKKKTTVNTIRNDSFLNICGAVLRVDVVRLGMFFPSITHFSTSTLHYQSMADISKLQIVV